MMRKFLKMVLPGIFFTTSCFENSVPKQSTALSCPTQVVQVFRVSYREDQGKYLIFHNASQQGSAKLPNPFKVENLQMAQIPTSSESPAERAQLRFYQDNGACLPLLEMTQAYKIELAAPSSLPAAQNQSASSEASSQAAPSQQASSSWAPFLMGALVGNAVSNALQTTRAASSPPAYYLPPPHGTTGGSVVTGGVSGKTPEELNKKYENQYQQSSSKKKGFFSNSTAEHSQNKKSGFFSGRRSSQKDSSSGKKTSGFFRNKKR
jgi:hypothetical protein